MYYRKGVRRTLIIFNFYLLYLFIYEDPACRLAANQKMLLYGTVHFIYFYSSSVIESSCEQEVENNDSSELPLNLGGNQLEVIPSMKAEHAGYKHEQLDSDDVESHGNGDDITEKQRERTVPCRGEAENWDTVGSEVISAIEEAPTGTASSHTETHKCHNVMVTYGSERGLDGDQTESRMIDNDKNSRSRGK